MSGVSRVLSKPSPDKGSCPRPAGATPANQCGERGAGALIQRRPLHIETLGAKHQAVHAGMGLRITDIGPGSRHPRLYRGATDRTGLSHRNVELLEPDGGEFGAE